MNRNRHNRTAFCRAGFLSLLTAVCVLCSSCAQGGTSSHSTSVSSQLTEPSGQSSSSTVTTVTCTAEKSQPEPTEEQSEYRGETQQAAEHTAESAEPIHETAEHSSDIAVQTSEKTEATSASSTTAHTTPKPNPAAEPVIPEVLTVEAPQKDAETTGTAMLDFSNASKGYIAASYSGASARAKLRIVCGEVTNDHDLATGGKVEFFPLSMGSGDYTVFIYEQLEGKAYTEALRAQRTVTVSDEVAMYLYPNKYVMFDITSDSVYKGAVLCTGIAGTVDRIAAIFAYITDNVTYDYELAATVTSGYIPNPDSVLAKGKGICFDYASLFAAMARSQGIPTRLVIGYASPDIYHAWNEVYTEETGWITPELLLSRKGFNLVDSTFYAGAADKSVIAEYINSSGNYSAVYRY